MQSTKRLISIAIAGAALAGALYWLIARAAPIADMDAQPVGYVGALDMNNYNLSSNVSVAYRGDYYRGTWDGDLVAYNISSTGTTSVKWQARDQLAAQHWSTGRKIFTMNATSGIPFTWTNTTTQLSTAQQAAMGGSPQGVYLLEWTRGNAAKENTSFRQRFSKLGDILHSRPYYFKHSASVERVYVGANDGMLHAFDATTGNEVFAYLPSMMISKLSQFSPNPYVSHEYGVDGLISISSFQNSGSTLTMLVSAMGAGGKGVFGLDVTNPTPATEAAAAAFAKWEITDTTTGFGNMGYVYGSTPIVKLNNGTRAVLVPNGVNSTNGRASLFVINVVTGALLTEIVADGTTADNGLTGITAADTNGDGKVDYVYGGDLAGKIWKFDFSGTAYPTSATALFTPAAGTERPIMAAPGLSTHPLGGVMVNFGTGKMLEPADLTTTTNEYLYGVWDSTKATSTTFVTPTLSTAVTSFTPTLTYRIASTSTVAYANGAKGWRITLSGGERLVGGDTLVDAGRFVITTAVPNSTNTPTYGGWLLELDALTGGGPATPFFDISGDGVVDQAGNSDKVTSDGGTTYRAPAGKFLGTGAWSQPILAQVNNSFDLAFFNFNPDSNLPSSPLTASTTQTTGGVAGGHFDFDIYYGLCNADSGSFSCGKNTHKHEYDDTYNVTGVNMLNPSLPAFNIATAITSTTTQSFSILLANENMSPAAQITIGTTTLPAWQWPTSPEGFLSDTQGGAARVFTRATLSRFIVALPLNAFSNQEWVPGSGDVRAGLVPTVTGCVHANQGAQGLAATGPWMNGALTIQVVKANVTPTYVELNMPCDTAFGYRLLKSDAAQANLLVQYTMFWHHPNGKCYGDAAWTKTPPPDTGSSTSGSPPAGTGDPTGNFATAPGGIGGGNPGTIYVYNGVEAYTVITYDATTETYTRTTKQKSNDAVLKTETFSDNPAVEIKKADKQLGSRVKLGRMAWQELLR